MTTAPGPQGPQTPPATHVSEGMLTDLLHRLGLSNDSGSLTLTQLLADLAKAKAKIAEYEARLQTIEMAIAAGLKTAEPFILQILPLLQPLLALYGINIPPALLKLLENLDKIPLPGLNTVPIIPVPVASMFPPVAALAGPPEGQHLFPVHPTAAPLAETDSHAGAHLEG